jgi:hypothetical protein
MIQNTWQEAIKSKYLCLIKHDAMKTYGRVKVQLHAFLNPAVYGSVWPQRQFGHCIKRKNFLPMQGVKHSVVKEAVVA